MKAEKLEDKAYCHHIWGRIGRGVYYGSSHYGLLNYGFENKFSAIYQRRFIKKYQRKGTQIVKMRFYRPPNPQTDLQQKNRARMTSAVLTYKTLKNQGLFDLVKSPIFNKKTGYHAFIPLFLRYKLGFYGNSLYARSQYGKICLKEINF